MKKLLVLLFFACVIFGAEAMMMAEEDINYDYGAAVVKKYNKDDDYKGKILIVKEIDSHNVGGRARKYETLGALNIDNDNLPSRYSFPSLRQCWVREGRGGFSTENKPLAELFFTGQFFATRDVPGSSGYFSKEEYKTPRKYLMVHADKDNRVRHAAEDGGTITLTGGGYHTNTGDCSGCIECSCKWLLGGEKTCHKCCYFEQTRYYERSIPQTKKVYYWKRIIALLVGIIGIEEGVRRFMWPHTWSLVNLVSAGKK